MAPLTITDEMVVYAAAALALKDCGPGAVLEAHDVPAYLTDDEGVLVYANDACERLAGRKPTPGVDRWVVTWKHYTDDGDLLAPDQCPMAVAIREKRSIRGVSAIAERPDGTRVPFRPFPTPIFDRDGRLVGAVNVLMPY